MKQCAKWALHWLISVISQVEKMGAIPPVIPCRWSPDCKERGNWMTLRVTSVKDSAKSHSSLYCYVFQRPLQDYGERDGGRPGHRHHGAHLQKRLREGGGGGMESVLPWNVLWSLFLFCRPKRKKNSSIKHSPESHNQWSDEYTNCEWRLQHLNNEPDIMQI